MAGYTLSDLFQFNPDGSYHPQSPFAAPDGNQGFDPNVYQQNDQGQPVAWAPAEATRRSLIDKAYNASLSPQQGGVTNFNTRFQPPSQLGTDVFNSLAQSGLWMPDGADITGKNQPIQARVDPNSGNIVVSDPRGGDANTSMYTYDPSGKFISQTVGQKSMSPFQGILGVLGAASGFGALGTLAAGGSIGLSGAASAAGLIPKQILPDIVGGMPSSTFSRGTNMGVFDQLGSSQAQQQAQAGKTPEQWAQMVSSGNTGLDATPSFGGLGAGSGGFDLSSILGNLGSGLGNLNLGQTLSGLFGASNTSQAGQTMIDFLKNQQNTMQQQGQTAQKSLMDFINEQQGKIDGLYNPGSPEANALQQQMEAKDAAAGRNSQYGTRAVDLAAKLASLKGGLDAQFAGSAIPAVNNSLNQAASNTNSFTQGTSRALAEALTQRASAFPSAIGSALGNAGGGGLGTLAQLLGGAGGGGANAGALLTKLFGGGGGGINGLLNGISDNGFNATAGGNLSIPDASSIDSIFNNPAFTGLGNTDFMNIDTNPVFGSSDFFNVGDISDWFQ